jgi:Tol biopolymer transport system component
VAAAVALAAGGWRLVGGEQRAVEPAPAPTKVTNGTLLARPASNPFSWVALEGEPPPAGLSQEVGPHSTVQFTSDGTELVYGDGTGTVVALDWRSGKQRLLGPCPVQGCRFSLSPDGTTLASSGAGGIQLTELGGSSEPRVVDVATGSDVPAWSPDGTQLAFATLDGVHVVDLATGQDRLVHTATDPTTVYLPVSWAPDGSALAFFDTQDRPRKGYTESDFTAMTVDLENGTTHTLMYAGHCACVGMWPPALTWSPDGTSVAIALRPGGTHAGTVLVSPDGSVVQQLTYSMYNTLVWQPVIE